MRRLAASVLAAALGSWGCVSTSFAEADLVLRRGDWIALEPLSLAELLRGAAGVSIARMGGLGSLEFLHVAGSTNGRIRIFLDGDEIGEPEFEWPRLQLVQMSMVERVEIRRTSDPVRIEIWTREATGAAPRADFDLGRGTLSTRTRRAQLFTPPRRLSVTLSYEELLRGEEEFRSVPLGEAAAEFGAYDMRSLLVRLELRRAADEMLRVEHQRFNDNAHGSALTVSDVFRANWVRNRLVWRRPWSSAQLEVDVGQSAWDRDRTVGGSSVAAGDARTHAAIGIERADSAWTAGARTRFVEMTGDYLAGGAQQRRSFWRSEVEARAERLGIWCFGGTLGAHRDERAPATWSGTLHGGRKGSVWDAGLEVGRGIAFAGVAEAGGIRSGEHVAATLGRRTSHTEARASAYAKRMHHGTHAVATFFPDAGAGPTRVAGLLLEASLHRGGGRRNGLVGISTAWTPHLRGDRGGLPEVQLRCRARASQSFFEGDLVVSAENSWFLDSERRFASGRRIVPGAEGDATVELRFLGRADFFWTVYNVTDARLETSPGVLLSGRRSLAGVRVSWLD